MIWSGSSIFSGHNYFRIKGIFAHMHANIFTSLANHSAELSMQCWLSPLLGYMHVTFLGTCTSRFFNRWNGQPICMYNNIYNAEYNMWCYVSSDRLVFNLHPFVLARQGGQSALPPAAAAAAAIYTHASAPRHILSVASSSMPLLLRHRHRRQKLRQLDPHGSTHSWWRGAAQQRRSDIL